MGAVLSRREGALLTLELSNPGKANALDLDMLAQIDAAAAQVQADPAIRVVVLRGGRGAFSSGADVKQWGPMSPEQFGRDWIAHGNRIFRRFERIRCPTVAAIDGLCFGGGLELALCCDLRIGSGAARFRFPEVTIGAIPGWEGGVRLARVVGRGRALETVLTACEIDAQQALQWGLLNRVYAGETFAAGVEELARRLATVSPRAAALAKAAIVGEAESFGFHETAAREIKSSADAEVGLRAFYEKKTPSF